MYNRPGVYIEEISTLPFSVAAVETAIPAFIGFTEQAVNASGEDLKMVPTRIKSMLEYRDLFGEGSEPNIVVEVTVADVISHAKVETIAASTPDPTRFKMYDALQAFFANGGGPCYIVSVGGYGVNNSNGNVSNNFKAMGADPTSPGALSAIKKIDEVTLLVFPDAAVLTELRYYELMQQALTQCARLQDRFTLIDVKTNGPTALQNDPPKALRNSSTLGTQNLSYGAAYYPHIVSSFSYPYPSDETNIFLSGGSFGAKISLSAAKADSNLAPLLTHQFLAQLKTVASNVPVELPPSPFIAGVYAAVDNSRGVWKAPANVSIAGVKKLTQPIDDVDQETLNVDATSGKSINAIRKFTGRGNMVWGARTLAGNDNEWRYVSVRRFFIMAEESIKKATARFVFESNDANTWVKVRAMIENFLFNQWRAGALTGAKPTQAFFVKVGLGETMTAQDILEGRMIIEIGMAVVRPAEFIILRFSHKMQEA